MKEYISLEEIFKAYYDCRKHKRNTKSAITFELNYINNLVQLWKELNNMTYEIGISNTFIVKYPKPREIFAASFRDRIVHHVLCNRLYDYIENELIDDTYSCRYNKGVQFGQNCLAEKIIENSDNYTYPCYVLCCDIKGFFTSINKNILNNKVSELIKKYYSGDQLKWMLWLSKKIILHQPQKNCIKKSPESLWKLLPKDKSLFTNDSNCGLPIGNLPSQLFANLYLSDLDHLIEKEFGKMYCRYVDDFRIVSHSKNKLLKFIQSIRNELLKVGLILHPNKISIQEVKKGVPFIGVIIKPGRIYVRNRLIYNMDRCINEQNDLLKLYSSINSYYGFLKGRATFNIRKRMYSKVGKKFPACLMTYESRNRLYLTKYGKTSYKKGKFYSNRKT